MEIEEFKTRFTAIKAKGFVPTTRKGPTGIGHTLESLLGITENNKARPDIKWAELKAHRSNSSNLITLFTFNKTAWKMPQLEAIQQYGCPDQSGRLGLYYTMSRTPNNAGLFLHVEDKEISVRHISGKTISVWLLSDLAERFVQKIPVLILVSALTEERNGLEHFHFFRARRMEGTSPELLADQFREENIVVDLRLHAKGESAARNHGTGFRVYEDKLPLLFQSITDL